ncbi:quinone-dependent dihydroorotate dehydrogenase [Halobacterium salinarum]|uniref:quinone-dependent dihydroorotate dehydrogenase n=1 Tax=Halobacterium salinarum TaxID=2242 RepID=UPI0025526566|nr:quinone-dependent dihydroorotate dehydrogenase [Halobacterium salinarum]MDL0135755.1 quinone-dependent dihydroorotate dehydrogenase [Halobacterium salinarum]
MYGLLKSALFGLPPETTHEITTSALRVAQRVGAHRAYAKQFTVTDPRLSVDAFGQTFPNPVGMAAGFDKNAEIPRALAGLGFGHIEVGAVTAERQPGNDRPRLFRLPDDNALVNRMGFNNEGADTVGARLDAEPLPDVPVGVNIGKSKTTPLADAPDDYTYTFSRVGDAVDYVVVNVSSPNTPGLRELQGRDQLAAILEALQDAGASPLLVKLSPDLHQDAVADAVELADDLGLDGIVATNTTTERPESLSHPHAGEQGGLSGAPIRERATEQVRFVAERTDQPVVGVGGVATAEDAYEKIRAGASVVQLYTALVYEGPWVAKRINEGLVSLLERDGFDSVEDAVGADL